MTTRSWRSLEEGLQSDGDNRGELNVNLRKNSFGDGREMKVMMRDRSDWPITKWQDPGTLFHYALYYNLIATDLSKLNTQDIQVDRQSLSMLFLFIFFSILIFQKNSNTDSHLQKMTIASKRAVDQRVTVKGNKEHQVFIVLLLLSIVIKVVARVNPKRQSISPFVSRNTGINSLIVLHICGNSNNPLEF